MYKNVFLPFMAKKLLGRGLLIVLLLSQFFLFGFTETDKDNLYSYQWGLKNNGNFLVDRAVLANTHIPMYFDKSINDVIFYDNLDMVTYFRSVADSSCTAYAMMGFDVKWEDAYKFFRVVEPKQDAIIAVIDTGVDIYHYELSDSLWVNDKEIPNNLIDDDLNGYIDDVNGFNFHHKNNKLFLNSSIDLHGTHAAGIMVAKHGNGGIKGLAYDEHVKVMPLKVLDVNENGYVSSVVSAIKYAHDNGAKICNLSLGSYKFEASIDKLIKEYDDMLFVVSAGNGVNFNGYSLDERDVYPAKLEYPNVITVSNACFEQEKYISANYGSYVDIFAPGTFILSTAPEGCYAYLTGTSMAAPFVSATCAMIYSRFPKVPISHYKDIIIKGATPIYSLQGLSKSQGMLNVYNSFMIASGY